MPATFALTIAIKKPPPSGGRLSNSVSGTPAFTQLRMAFD
ncbi:hypothetical protein FACS189485_21750 [Spirochaetia bacterium]|nr:hypothetical protein FACS189485_21750 [Spirochaetia bacterium]